jgi:hypothetical protein
VLLEATFTGTPPDANHTLSDDLNPFAISDRETLAFVLAGLEPQVHDPIAELTRIGLLLPGPDPASFRLRRPLQIVYPAADAATKKVAGTGALPVVVLQHGAHRFFDNKTVSFVDSYKGFRYLQDTLAGLGIVSVSVDVNAANLFESTLIEMRARLAVSALDSLRALSLDAQSIFHDRLDFTRLGLFGHSRGGDAVVRAAKMIAAGHPQYKVKFVCSLAPTDLSGRAQAGQRMILTPAETSFFALLYGMHDGDVNGAGGARELGGTAFRHYDRATAPKSMIFLDGCSHNRFNATWVRDTAPAGTGDEFGSYPADLLPEATHQALVNEYVGALARWQLLGQTPARTRFSGDDPNLQGVEASVQFSFGSTVGPLDDFENPLAPRQLHSATIDPLPDTIVNGRTLELETNHETSVLTFPPSGGSVSPELIVDLPATFRDWTRFTRLTIRTTSLFDLTSAATIAAGSPPDLELFAIDGGSNRDALTGPTGSRGFPHFHRGFDRELEMVSTAPDGTSRTIVATKTPHGLSDGDEAKIEVARDEALKNQGLLVLNGIYPITRIDDTHFAVPKTTTVNLGKGFVGRLKNWTRHRLETAVYTFPSLEALLGNVPFNLKDVRQLEIRQKAAFPQHVFLDSIELVKD